ncbi:hypothetical protein FRB99_002516 [Tulasnella sp. 403]|nr:hypothetical protein FRB99_002516 [Tulasnella sp. 403]
MYSLLTTAFTVALAFAGITGTSAAAIEARDRTCKAYEFCEAQLFGESSTSLLMDHKTTFGRHQEESSVTCAYRDRYSIERQCVYTVKEVIDPFRGDRAGYQTTLVTSNSNQRCAKGRQYELDCWISFDTTGDLYETYV